MSIFIALMSIQLVPLVLALPITLNGTATLPAYAEYQTPSPRLHDTLRFTPIYTLSKTTAPVAPANANADNLIPTPFVTGKKNTPKQIQPTGKHMSPVVKMPMAGMQCAVM
ncbi:hypothetical protein BKA66DRAFT_440705 [Pyrenochaeta sp. MPI-SDFR-AT-0127]|nr:hypothetical protein BKA66DRAFT_440705 [Pyrenochaeta sp. MPI-SDFR-AT-0127]